MKGNSNNKPENFSLYGNTGRGQVNFNIEQNNNVQESWDYDVVEVNDFKRETVIAAIIREKYSQHAVEAILNNHLAGTDTGEFAQLQAWRNVAKSVADGVVLKVDLLPILTITTQSRLEEIDETLQAVTETLIEKGITP